MTLNNLSEWPVSGKESRVDSKQGQRALVVSTKRHLPKQPNLFVQQNFVTKDFQITLKSSKTKRGMNLITERM